MFKSCKTSNICIIQKHRARNAGPPDARADGEIPSGGGAARSLARWHGCVDAWMRGWMDVWMHGWMDGCMDAFWQNPQTWDTLEAQPPEGLGRGNIV